MSRTHSKTGGSPERTLFRGITDHPIPAKDGLDRLRIHLLNRFKTIHRILAAVDPLGTGTLSCQSLEHNLDCLRVPWPELVGKRTLAVLVIEPCDVRALFDAPRALSPKSGRLLSQDSHRFSLIDTPRAISPKSGRPFSPDGHKLSLIEEDFVPLLIERPRSSSPISGAAAPISNIKAANANNCARTNAIFDFDVVPWGCAYCPQPDALNVGAAMQSKDDALNVVRETPDVSTPMLANDETLASRCSPGEDFALTSPEQDLLRPDQGLTHGAVHPSAERFAKFLQRRYGTLLRAWKIGLDVKARGRINYHDLSLACQSLGIARQTRDIWKSFRSDTKADGSPLELVEVAPDEAGNLDIFVERMLLTLGADCQLHNFHNIWSMLDPGCSGKASLGMFKRFAKKLRFGGDADLLFHGLDGSGRGQVDCADFAYIWKISWRLPPESFGDFHPKGSPIKKMLDVCAANGVQSARDNPVQGTGDHQTFLTDTSCPSPVNSQENQLATMVDWMFKEYGRDHVYDAFEMQRNRKLHTRRNNLETTREQYRTHV